MTISNARKKEAEQVFNRWKASLADKPKNHKHLYENFDELFYDLHRLQLPYDFAYDYLERAYGAHYPSNKTIKWQYKNSSWAKQAGSEDEFGKQWKDLIKDKATSAFHSYFEINFTDEKTPQEAKRDRARAKASARIKEYMENFEPVDVHAIRKKIEEEKKLLSSEPATDLLSDLELNNG